MISLYYELKGIEKTSREIDTTADYLLGVFPKREFIHRLRQEDIDEGQRKMIIDFSEQNPILRRAIKGEQSVREKYDHMLSNRRLIRLFPDRRNPAYEEEASQISELIPASHFNVRRRGILLRIITGVVLLPLAPILMDGYMIKVFGDDWRNPRWERECADYLDSKIRDLFL